jgi:hypothetical protein
VKAISFRISFFYSNLFKTSTGRPADQYTPCLSHRTTYSLFPHTRRFSSPSAPLGKTPTNGIVGSGAALAPLRIRRLLHPLGVRRSRHLRPLHPPHLEVRLYVPSLRILLTRRAHALLLPLPPSVFDFEKLFYPISF